MDIADFRTEGLARLVPGSAVESRHAISLHGSLAEVEALWRGLERTAVGSPFQRYGFCRAWITTVGERLGVEPLIVVGRSQTVGAFVLPLVLTSRGPFRVAEFPGESHANLNVGLFDPAAWNTLGVGDAQAILGAIAEDRPDVDLLHLRAQPLALAGRPNPFVDARSVPSPHFACETSLEGGFDGVLERHRGSKKRKRMRQSMRAFEALGPAAVRKAETPAEGHRIIDTFLAYKASRFAAKGIPNVFAEPGTAEFLHALVDESFATSSPVLDLFGFEVGDVCRAVEISTPFGGRRFGLMNAFLEDEYARHSPGEVALYHVIEDACRCGFDTYDFGVGDARYKRSWSDADVPLADTILPLTTAGMVAAGIVNAKRRLRDFIVARPALYRVAQRIRSRSARLATEEPPED